MSNPVLERQFGKTTATSGGAGTAAATADATMTTAAPPVPTVPVTEGGMSVGGTVRATFLLLVILLGGAVFGWRSVDEFEGMQNPGLLFGALIGAVVLAIAASFVPKLAATLGPLYAAVEGFLLGAISHVYEIQFEGIVLQAVLATAAIFVVMLTLFVTRTIKVSDRMRSWVIGATIGVAFFYLVSIVLSFFNVNMPLVWDTGPLGIIFSLVVIGVAAFNLLLDFDLIERGTAAGMPRFMNWYAAFGLMVTIVWLYLEMLRLLARTRQ
jgi:uncharacterized YccA/Bax inhibitor family protein